MYPPVLLHRMLRVLAGTLLLLTPLLSGCPDSEDGPGATPRPGLEDNQEPHFQVDPTALDFGGVLVGESAEGTITVSNVGDSNLFIGTVRLTDDDGVFTLSGDYSNLTVVSGNPVSIEVTFAPEAAQLYGATLEIQTNDEDYPVAYIALTGKGCGDEDGDGTSDCTDDDSDGYSEDDGDCDDADPEINPGADEQCDGEDDNCNGQIDEGTDFDQDGDGYTICGGDCNDSDVLVHPDADEVCNGQDDDCDGAVDEGYDQDGDGYSICGQPADCDDSDADINPGAEEICDGLDNDCDGIVDDGFDGDGDGTSDCTDDDSDGYTEQEGDCDDADPDTNPGADETCDGQDNNCDGEIDEGYDGDGDGTADCTDDDDDGYSEEEGDCDDTDPGQNPGEEEACNGTDDNCNGQVDEGTDLDKDGDGYTICENDCNDNDASIHPGATELCNGKDDDCDGQIDDGLPTSAWYQDSDGDTYGNAAQSKQACYQPTGYVANSTDCDDSDASIHPGASEVCNGRDDDCDGQVDEGYDADGDGTADCQDNDGDGYSEDEGDCDDGNGGVHPGAGEICNGDDDDCDGQADEGLPSSTWYLDGDGDGYGSSATSMSACSQPDGYVANQTDCNDASASIHPGATELCNGIDDDCDGSTDEGVTTNYYPDADSDGYGQKDGIAKAACSQPTGYVTDHTDCDDGDGDIHPGASELCNGIDDDCDGQEDEGFDLDGDGSADCDEFDDDGDGYTENEGDCDDADNTVYPVLVDGTYSGTVKDGSSSHPFTEIQAGINAAGASCPVVLVKPDTYTERIDFKGKVLTVQSTGGADVTIIDGAGVGPVVTFQMDEDSSSVLDGFTVTNGSAAYGAGVYISGASPVIKNNVITDNDCTAGGGGLYAEDGAPQVLDNEFSHNVGPTNVTSPSVAGGAVLLDNAPATLTGNTFTDNTHVKGGAIALLYGADAAIGTTASGGANIFTSNDATDTAGTNGSGGAIYAYMADPIIRGNTFTQNAASDAGGAIYVIAVGGASPGDTTATIDQNTFTGNTAGNVASTLEKRGIGGAICSSYATTVVTDNTFQDNIAAWLGGGLYIKNGSVIDASGNTISGNEVKYRDDTNKTGGAGGGVYIAASTGTLSDNQITENITGFNGAGVVLTVSADGTPAVVDLLDNVISDNNATISPYGKAGGIYVQESSGTISGNTISGNQASESGGGLILQDASFTVQHNIVRGNSAGSRGAGLYLLNPTSTTAKSTVVNNIVQGNTTDGYGGGVYYSSIGTGKASRGELINNVIVENSALSSGAGVYVGQSSAAVLMNNIVYKNLTAEGIYVYTGTTSASVTYNDSKGNGDDDYGGQLATTKDASNLSIEPSFQSYTADGSYNDNFHLASSSGVKNQGNPDASYNDPDGSRNDMGAYGGQGGSW